MEFKDILPYIVSVVSSLIAGVSSWLVSRKQTKEDLEKLEKQHELDIQKERELFQMEKEKMEMNHQHQLELLEKENKNALSAGVIKTILAEAMKNPAIQQQITQSTNGRNNRRQ